MEKEKIGHRMLSVIKRDWHTIPNILSYFRLLLIPLLIWLYMGREYLRIAAVVVVVSALTDVADGYLARHYNMVSDLGKVIDPVADKLTQFTMFICLSVRYKIAIALLVILVAREVTVVCLGMHIFKDKGEVYGAKWYGKVNTTVVLVTVFALIIFPSIPRSVANVILCVCIVVSLFSFFMYTRYYIGLNKSLKEHNG